MHYAVELTKQKAGKKKMSDGGVELQSVHPSSFAICSGCAGLLVDQTSHLMFSHFTI